MIILVLLDARTYLILEGQPPRRVPWWPATYLVVAVPSVRIPHTELVFAIILIGTVNAVMPRTRNATLLFFVMYGGAPGD